MLIEIIPILGRIEFLKPIVYRLRKFVSQKAPVIAKMKISQQKIKVNPSDFVGFDLFAFGSFEEHVSIAALKLGLEGKDVIDAGANIGAFTFNVAKFSGRVLAIDASRECCRLLHQNIEYSSQENIQVVHAALTDQYGEIAELRISSNTLGNNSIIYQGDPSSSVEKVQTETIDHLVTTKNLDPYLIKIDVEGAEVLLFKGARETIEKHNPMIIFEWNGYINRSVGADVDQYSIFREPNYSFYRILFSGKVREMSASEIHGLSGEPQCLDILCIPTKYKSLVKVLR